MQHLTQMEAAEGVAHGTEGACTKYSRPPMWATMSV